MFFNELACPAPQPRDRILVDGAMSTFARLMRHIARRRADAALVSAIHLKDLELASGYYLAEWAGAAGGGAGRRTPVGRTAGKPAAR